MARGGMAALPGRPVRAGVLALLLLVLVAALCTKAVGSAGSSAVPLGASDAVTAHACTDTATDTASPGADDGGTRCAQKPPSTEAHPAPQPADPGTVHTVAVPDAPSQARVLRLPGKAHGPAPPVSRHVTLSVLRI